MAATFTCVGLGDETVLACDAVSIPAVGIDRCVVAGGQAEIDQGDVVRFDTLSSGNVHWLAAHRTSHGGAFGALVDLDPGDVVRYRGNDDRVSDHRLVNRFEPSAIADWALSPRSSVILQTSHAGALVHVWRAVQVDVAPVPRPFDVVVAVPPVAAGRMTVLNVTATDTAAPGYVTVYACDRARPPTSSLNTAPGTITSNLVIVEPDRAGRICLYSSDTTDLIIDAITTTITTITSPSPSTTPTRLHDTRAT